MAKRTTNSSKGVRFSRNELNILLPSYYMIRDVLEGEPAIKGLVICGNNPATAFSNWISGIDIFNNAVLARAKNYLPMPNPHDTSPENQERYRNYLKRAVFYGATARTLQGMVGQVFLRDPAITVPGRLQSMLNNIDGAGLTERQFAKRTVKTVASHGRAGLLVDFPATTGPVSQADITSGKITPTFSMYYPWDIINWRTDVVNGKKILTLVVIQETSDGEGDVGFTIEPEISYRVLRLVDGVYVQEIHSETTNGNYGVSETILPTDGDGQRLTEIPFMFIGSESNDEVPDKPPIYDLASVNIAHYRNSADYEESSYQCGQPTPVAIGLTRDWVQNVLKDKVFLGSKSVIPLPVGASIELIQANPNNLPGEAMKMKEGQMVALGAKLVEKMAVQRTATETIIDSTSETSILLTIATNVSAAMEWGFGWASRFIRNAGSEKIVYKLNKDFELTKMSPQDRDSIIIAWQSGAILFEEMRTALRVGGIANSQMGDDEAMTKLVTQAKKFQDAGIFPDPTKNGNDPRPKGQQGKKGRNPKDQPLQQQ